MQWPELTDPPFAQRGTESRRGEPCTVQSSGEHLDVMPRQLASILSQLDDSEKAPYPWHRVEPGIEGLFIAAEHLPSGLPRQKTPAGTSRKVKSQVGSVLDEMGIAPQSLPFASAW